MATETDSDDVRHGLADVPLIIEDLLCQSRNFGPRVVTRP
jgi:hypothetical protein